MLNTVISTAASFMLVALPPDNPENPQTDVKAIERLLVQLHGRTMIDTKNRCVGKEVADYQISLSYPGNPMIIVTAVSRKPDMPYQGHCMISTLVIPRTQFNERGSDIKDILGPEMSHAIEEDLRGIDGIYQDRMPRFKR